MSGTTIGYTMTLANSIIGVGILAMPFCFQKCGILLSMMLLVLSNFMTRLTCNYLLQTSIRSRRRNFESMALHIFGSSGKLLVELCIIGYLFGSCVTYYVVVGDLGPQILAKLFDINVSDSLRTIVMVIVTIVCIVPLSLLRNMESLSHVSTTSIIFYFCLVIKIIFDSEEKITTNYWIDTIYWWRPSGILQCLPIFCMSLSCQTQMFEVYESLPNQSLEKMNCIVKAAVNMCTGVYILVGVFGYVAYSGREFSGNILLSFSPSLASEIIKTGFVLSVAFSFPLVIFPCRASLYSLIYHRSHSEVSQYIPEHRFQYITVSIVLTALIIGILIPSIELVIGLVGSTIGVAICLMFPASCYIKTNKKGSMDRLFAQFLLVFAFVLMILGTFANLEAIDEQQAGIHDNSQVNAVVDSIPVPIVDKLPPSVQKEKLAPQEVNLRSSGKRKPNKTQKALPSNEAEQIMGLVNISNRVSDAKRVKVEAKPIGPSREPVPDTVGAGAKIPDDKAAEASGKKARADGEKIAAEPDRSAGGKVDSGINNDAIQKEEQEIAIDAKEDQQKSLETAKEILNEVKSELAKQNEKTQQLVLEKIDKISEKVNKIEQLQEEEKQRESASLKKHDEVADYARETKDDAKKSEGGDKPAKKTAAKEAEPNETEGRRRGKAELPEAENEVAGPDRPKVSKHDVVRDPVVESILPRTNPEQKPNGNQAAPESGEKVGRDLLGLKWKNDGPAKSRRKRSVIRRRKTRNYRKLLKEGKLPSDTVLIRNKINPKYPDSQIEFYRKGWRANFEVHNAVDIHPVDRVPSEDPMFDDSRFDKYVGKDDSFVFPLDGENSTDFGDGEDELVFVQLDNYKKNNRKIYQAETM